MLTTAAEGESRGGGQNFQNRPDASEGGGAAGTLGGLGDLGASLIEADRASMKKLFQDCMQLRRSLQDVEDKNARNTLNITERWNSLLAWESTRGVARGGAVAAADESYELAYHNAWSSTDDASATMSNEKSVRHRRVMSAIQAKGAPEGLQTAWAECQELRRAIVENEEVSGRLTAAVSGAEVRLYDLHTKLQGHRRSHAEGGSVELVESLFQTGVLELENMELEQTTLVQVCVSTISTYY